MKPTPMDTSVLFTLLLIGLTAGCLSGLVGVGGGVVLVPAFAFFLHYNQHQAQGTSLGILSLPVVALAFFSYYKDCREMGTPIEFKVVMITALAFVVGGFLGSKIALKIDQDMLKKIFAVVLFYTGINLMGWDKLFMKWVKQIFS